MKKKVMLGVAASLVLSAGVAMASPTAMDEGKWNVTVGVLGETDGSMALDGYDSFDLDGATSLYGSVIYGLTDKWGLEAGYGRYNFDDIGMNYDADVKEFNLLYKLSPYANVFAGYVDADFKLHYVFSGMQAPDHEIGTDSVQVGLMGHYPLTRSVDLFGRVALGTHSHAYEVGLSYAFAPHWGLNVSYYDAQYRDFCFYGVSSTLDTDGVRIGVSAAF